MNFEQLIKQLNDAIQLPLPGIEAHKELSPLRALTKESYAENSSARKAGVMGLLYPKQNEAYIVLTQRHSYPGVHGGQISFPGGKQDPEDKDLIATAFRETREEIGVPQQDIRLIGALSQIYIPPSNFFVQPSIGFCTEEPQFQIQEAEVAHLVEVPIKALLLPETLQKHPVNIRGYQKDVPCYKIGKHIIWGATAVILSELLFMIRQSK